MVSTQQPGRRAFPVSRLAPDSSDYPPWLKAMQPAPASLSYIGARALLERPALALFCSVKCPGSVIMKTYEAMQVLKLQEGVVAGGFHSPMERTCLDILLRGRMCVILCPARGIRRLRVHPEWKSVLASNRLLIVSPFDDPVRRSTVQLAATRNRFVAALADRMLIPFAARQSRTEQFAREMLARGKIVYTFAGEDSQNLVDLGACPFLL